MAQSEQIHIAFDISFCHTDGRWNMPGSWVGYDYYPDPRFYKDLTRLAARGRIDMLFFGDGTGIPDTYQGSLDGGVRWGVQWPRHDKSPLVPLMADAAPGPGFCITFSPTYMHPYYVARLLVSLDHLTGGRIALNLITSSRLSDAANYGYDALMEHDTRYDRAEEFATICRQLWDSVGPDALVLDRESGVFADPKQVNAINFRGDFWNVRGPLNCLAGPQGRPVLIQAGQSDRGINSSARYAEVVFAGSGPVEFMKRHRTVLDGFLAEEGRKPRDVGILWSTQVVIGDTVDEARAKLNALAAHQPSDAAAVKLSHGSGFDFSTLPPKFTLGEVAEAIESRGGSQMSTVHRVMRELGPDHEMTLNDLIEHSREHMAGSGAVCGTAIDIADHLVEQHYETGANGGFMIQGTTGPQPRSLTDFVDYVIPELQRRKMFRREYECATLRELLAS